jgi:hypothetical protein
MRIKASTIPTAAKMNETMSQVCRAGVVLSLVFKWSLTEIAKKIMARTIKIKAIFKPGLLMKQTGSFLSHNQYSAIVRTCFVPTQPYFSLEVALSIYWALQE